MENKELFYRFLSEYIFNKHPKLYEEAIKYAAVRAEQRKPVLFSDAPPCPEVEMDIEVLSDEAKAFIDSWDLKL